MIDSKELKQGAWFFFEKYGEGYLCLNDEYEFYIFFPNQSNEMLSKFSLSEIKPIPLSSELLSKIEGIKREERGKPTDFDGVEIVWYYNGVDLFEEEGEFYYATYTRYSGRGFKSGIQIKTLHHYQNLIFCLSGNELKLNI